MVRSIRGIPRVEPSDADKEVGRAITSYAALERIRKLIPKLLPGDLAVLCTELARDQGYVPCSGCGVRNYNTSDPTWTCPDFPKCGDKIPW